MSDRRSMQPDWDGRMRGQMLGGIRESGSDAVTTRDLKPITESLRGIEDALHGIEDLLAIFVMRTTGETVYSSGRRRGRRWSSDADPYLTPEQARSHMDAWAASLGGNGNG